MSGTIAPTTVAAALSAASYGGASAVTSSKSLVSSIEISIDSMEF